MKSLINICSFLAICSLAFGCGGARLSDYSGAYTGNLDYTPHGLFPATEPWYKDISALSKSASSDAIIQNISTSGGWGQDGLRMDFSMEVVQTDQYSHKVSWQKTSNWFDPDCDEDNIPVPEGGAVEGEEGYECVNNGDCRYIAVNKSAGRLYEMRNASYSNGKWLGGCLAVWDLAKSYPGDLRGDQCASADFAGLPIAPMLFNANQVYEGAITHALRFVLPASTVRRNYFVRPATHASAEASAGSNAPPYGVRLRLKADYDMIKLPDNGARVIARALQKYGMFLSSDGSGTAYAALSAQSDRFTRNKWKDLVGAEDLSVLDVTDFEVVDMGAPVSYTGACVRN